MYNYKFLSTIDLFIHTQISQKYLYSITKSRQLCSYTNPTMDSGTNEPLCV